MTDGAAVAAAIAASQDELARRLAALTVDELRAPSRLPDWDRLTVVCHIRYGALAINAMVAAALRGEAAGPAYLVRRAGHGASFCASVRGHSPPTDAQNNGVTTRLAAPDGVADGDRGRLVVPAEVRERAGISEGTVLILLETPDGLVLLTRDQLARRVRQDLSGLDLVGDLLAERRAAAAAEDAA